MELQTSTGHSYLIDYRDINLISDIIWHKTNEGYIQGYCKKRKKRILMHRLILGIVDEPNLISDHKNRIRTDNTRLNLRVCTRKENNMNKTSSGTSKYLGVCILVKKRKIKDNNGIVRYLNRKPCIVSSISINSKNKHLGTFRTEIDAAKAYNEAALKYHGEFANLNTFD